MSRRRSGVGPEPVVARARVSRAPWLWLSAVLVLAAAIVLWGRAPRTPRLAPSPEPLATQALIDSVREAEGRGDWERALGHMQRLTDANPRNAVLLLALGKSWGNYAWAGGTYGRPRTALRTSLERVRILRHALALEDSASAMATTAREQVMVSVQWGRMLELIGLPVDALAHYEEAFRVDSTDRETRERIGSTIASLRDPRPDLARAARAAPRP